MSVRRLLRIARIARALVGNLVRYGCRRLLGPLTFAQRAQWLQESSCAVLNAMGLSCLASGPQLRDGMIVANHLSYLDILALAAVMPCCFVAKAEVARWPVLGAFARMAGTIFLDRASMASAALAANQVSARLQAGIPVVLFPEGTSTDGADVLPFRPRLLKPAIDTGATITSAAIRYLTASPAVPSNHEREVCWYGDQRFAAHLWKILALERITVQLRFGATRIYSDARMAASIAHRETRALRRFGALTTF